MLSASPDPSQVRLLVSLVLLVSTAPHCTAADADDQGVMASRTPAMVASANLDSVRGAVMGFPFVSSELGPTICPPPAEPPASRPFGVEWTRSGRSRLCAWD